jgi:hypothetical protein
MTLKLIKMSESGWEKEFDTEEALRIELYKHICNLCRKGSEEDMQEPVGPDATVWDMFATPCGCEYDIEGLTHPDLR